MRRILVLSCVIAAAASARPAQAVRVQGFPATNQGDVLNDAVLISVEEPGLITIGRTADGSVIVRNETPQPRMDASGTCSSAPGTDVALCPGSIRTAAVRSAPWAPGPMHVRVEPGSQVDVAVFGGPSDDDLDLSGALTSQVNCGGGLDTVQADSPRIWGDCEQVNGRPATSPAVIGRVRGDELDAAPGGLAWIDMSGRLHLRTGLTGPELTLRPRVLTIFRHLDVGLDRRGRAVATVGECRSPRHCNRWLSFDVASGRRSVLRLPRTPGCRVVSVARWRTATALGVTCRGPRHVTLIVQSGAHRRGFSFSWPNTSEGPSSVDVRGRLVAADWHSDGAGDALWAVRIGPRSCRAITGSASWGPESGSAAGRQRIVSGDRILYGAAEEGPSFAQSSGAIISVGPTCEADGQNLLLSGYSSAMTLIGTTLVRANQWLTAEPLVTSPPPLYPIASPAQVFGY